MYYIVFIKIYTLRTMQECLFRLFLSMETVIRMLKRLMEIFFLNDYFCLLIYILRYIIVNILVLSNIYDVLIAKMLQCKYKLTPET